MHLYVLASNSSRLCVQILPAATCRMASGRSLDQPGTPAEGYEKNGCYTWKLHNRFGEKILLKKTNTCFAECFLIWLPSFPTQILTSTLFFFNDWKIIFPKAHHIIFTFLKLISQYWSLLPTKSKQLFIFIFEVSNQLYLVRVPYHIFICIHNLRSQVKLIF